MKNKFIALVCIALGLQVHTLTAKNDSTSVIKNGIGISVAPMLCMPSYVNQNNYQQNAYKAGLGVSAALCENIVLSKKANLYFFLELGYQTTAFVTTASSVAINVSGNFQPTATSKLFYRNNNGMFSLSIQKTLFHLGKKAGVFLGIGAQANYCFSQTETFQQTTVNASGQSATTTLYSKTSTNISPDYQWSAYALARLGVFINPLKHLGINMAPVFYYGLNPNYIFTKNNPGYNTLAFNVQIMYNF